MLKLICKCMYVSLSCKITSAKWDFCCSIITCVSSVVFNMVPHKQSLRGKTRPHECLQKHCCLNVKWSKKEKKWKEEKGGEKKRKEKWKCRAIGTLKKKKIEKGHYERSQAKPAKRHKSPFSSGDQGQHIRTSWHAAPPHASNNHRLKDRADI